VARSLEKCNPSFTKYQKTRKPEYQKYQKPENQKHQSKNPQIKFEGGKSWIFEISTTPAYSPQPNASIPWIRISKLEV
jgi:hypothetical protein